MEALKENLLAAVGLDGLQAAHRFLHVAVHFAQLTAPRAVQRTNPLRPIAGKEHGHGNRDRKDQHQQRRQGEHHVQRAAHGNHAGKHLRQVVGQGRVHRIHIIGKDGDYVAGLMGVKEADRQRTEALE